MPKIMLNGIEYASGLDEGVVDKIGLAPLNTTAQDLSGAVNELKSSLDDKNNLAMVGVTGTNGILNYVISAPVGISFVNCQNASDNPASGTVGMAIIFKINSSSLYTNIWVLSGAHLYRATTGGSIPSTLSWTTMV